MNLTKQQIEALATKVQSKLKEEAEQEYERKISLHKKAINKEYEKGVKILDGLPDSILAVIPNYGSLPKREEIKKRLFTNIVNEYNIEKPKTKSKQEIVDEILIASIDSTDLTALLKKLNITL